MGREELSTYDGISLLKDRGQQMGLVSKANRFGFRYRIETAYLMKYKLNEQFEIKEDIGTEYCFVTHYRQIERAWNRR